VGLEALSRGAGHVTFVERDPRAVALIRTNLQRCGVADRHVIIRSSFGGAFARDPSAGFDIVFLDPPYGGANLIEALDAAAPLVGAETLLVLEHARRDESPVQRGGLQRTRVLTSGDSALGFYRQLHATPGA
jgi:16S rRNA (guanine966-N2)-methyltransferase